MKKIASVLAISICVLVLAAAGILAFTVFSFTKSSPSKTAQEVIYEVKPGASFVTIAKELEDSGLVTNARLFNYYARFVNMRDKVKVGEYQLFTTMKPLEVLNAIASGKSIAKSFTISEGLSTYEIALQYDRQGYGKAAEFLALTRDKDFIQSVLGEPRTSLEGYLFPETYMITKYATTKSLIASMVKRFLHVFEEVKKNDNQIKWMNRHQIVTLASIIEKETGAPEERPLISSVFHNRLVKRMRLQTDPTVIYGKAETLGKIVISITRKDLSSPTPYNTYQIPGLPPGPIANPGKESLLAALNPADSKFLFFVSRNDGTHVFSENYKDHNAAVKDFQLNRKAREGKSWRDLNNRKKAN